MFNEQVLQRLIKANKDDKFNSYGEHVKMTGGIRYGLHPTPEMDFQPDSLYTGTDMYKPPRMVGGRLIGGAVHGQMINDLEERGGSLKSIGKSLSRGLKKVGKVVAPIAKDVVMPVVKDFATKQGRKLLEQQLARFAIKDALPVAEEVAPLMLAAGRKRKTGGRISGGNLVGSGRRESRAMLVKKIMREKGCSLPEASKYIKENNLTY